MKKIFGFLVVLFLLLGAAAYWLMQNLDQIVQEQVEKQGTALLDTPVRLEGVTLKLLDGFGELRGFSVANPKGFSDAKAMGFGVIRLDLDEKRPSASHIRIQEITLDSVSALYELNGQGQGNLNVLLDQLKRQQSSASSEAEPVESDPDAPARPNPAEEFRRIQEEIRRRIRERTHPNEESEPASESNGDPYSDSRPEEEAAPTPAPVLIPAPNAWRREGDPGTEVPATPRRDPLAELEAMRERAEQTRLDLESKRSTDTPVEPRRRYQTTVNYGSLRQKAIAALQRPNSARAAFLYQEIFGTPVGLRDAKGTTRPSWEQ